MDLQLTGQQEQALEVAHRFFQRHREGDRRQQVLKFQGAAGTGKTTLASQLASTCRLPLFAAPTGKAASVLTRKGCPASTCHQLIYQPMEAARTHLTELKAEEKKVLAELEAANATHHSALQEQLKEVRQKIRDEEDAMNRPFFALKTESQLRDSDGLFLDESSQVDEVMGQDLESFGAPIVAIGDPFQLPPIRGLGYFTTGTPDVLLTEIHRQALGSPILELATMVREGHSLPLGYRRDELAGKAAVITGRPDPQMVIEADQILCGRNATRVAINNRCRTLLGHTLAWPEPGDRLVCLRNNHELGLANGTIWTVENFVGSRGTGTIVLDLINEDGHALRGVEVHSTYFEGKEPEKWAYRDAEHFDFGYALTVHKAQGSQWDKVVLFDDWRGGDRRQWLYTGITRAAKALLIVQ